MTRHTLVKEYRPETDCGYTFNVSFGDPPIHDRVSIWEHYEYYGGNEYAYRATIERPALPQLAEALADEAGLPPDERPANPERLVVAALRQLLESGQLTTRPLKAGYAKVKAMLDAAGIAYREDPWVWVDFSE